MLQELAFESVGDGLGFDCRALPSCFGALSGAVWVTFDFQLDWLQAQGLSEANSVGECLQRPFFHEGLMN